MCFNPYTHIHSYLNIPDTSGRDSLFQAESRVVKKSLILSRTTKLNVILPYLMNYFQELNPVEASRSAYAFLLYLSKYDNVDFILTTHYTSICKKLQKYVIYS